MRRIFVLFVLISVFPGAKAQVQTAVASTFVYRCDGLDQAIVVTIDGVRGHLFSRWVSQPLHRATGNPAYRGADVYYLPAEPADTAPGQAAEITVKGNRFATCKNDPRAAIWEGAKLRGVSFRAIGQEPAWVLEIDRQQGFLLTLGYAGSGQRFPYTEPLSDPVQRSSQYRSESNADSISISIKAESCRDTLSGDSFSSSVEIIWRDKTLRGCGRPLH